MKVRVITYDTYEKWYEEQWAKGNGKGISELTDSDFMKLYKREDSDWCFDSLEEFVEEFNQDGAYAPTPSHHIIRFFPNE